MNPLTKYLIMSIPTPVVILISGLTALHYDGNTGFPFATGIALICFMISLVWFGLVSGVFIMCEKG